MFLFNLSPFMAPEEVVDNSPMGKEDMITFMGEDDEKEEVLEIDDKKVDAKENNKEDKKEDEESDKKDEIDELEEELEEPDDEKLELDSRPRKRDILKDFPELFKKYPGLEKAYYREQQFTELLSTIEDAKEAVTKADILDKFESDVSQGNLENAIQAVKGSGEKAFNNLVDNYLPNLAKVDKDAYHHVVGNIVKTTIAAMINEGKSSNDDDLQAAARILNQFVFGTNQVIPPSMLSKPEQKNEKEEELNRREHQLREEKFNESRDAINTKVANVLKSTIEANIDPKESMTDYVRKNASREALEELETLLEKDTRLERMLNKLWLQAAKENFSRVSTDRIKNTYLSVAKTLLPSAIKKARIEALKGSGKRVREDDEETGQSKRGPIPAGRTSSGSHSESRKSDREKAGAIPKGMSYQDYLMKDSN